MRKLALFKMLEKPYMLRILLFLSNHEKATYSDVISALPGSQPTKLKALNNLVAMELIAEERKHPRRYFSLTPKGQRIAEKIKEIKNIVEALD